MKIEFNKNDYKGEESGVLQTGSFELFWLLIYIIFDIIGISYRTSDFFLLFSEDNT